MSAINEGLSEAFFAMRECKCLKVVWDIARPLWMHRFERAVFVGGLLDKRKFLLVMLVP